MLELETTHCLYNSLQICVKWQIPHVVYDLMEDVHNLIHEVVHILMGDVHILYSWKRYTASGRRMYEPATRTVPKILSKIEKIHSLYYV